MADDLAIRPLNAACGAEVAGIDLRTPLVPEDAATLRSALAHHGVLFFRGQQIDDVEHRDFAKHFGVLHDFPFGSPPTPDAPEVHVIEFEQAANAAGRGADEWHNDATFQSAPPRAAMLRAVVLPDTGGDTCFANTHAAFLSLSPALQRLIEPLEAEHSYATFAPVLRRIRPDDADERLAERLRVFPPVRHRVVIEHPVTGRPHLFVNRNYTSHLIGLTERENATVLPLLFDAVRAPEVQCRFRWSPGSIAVWDNLAVQHYAVADYGSHRRMHRVTIDA